MKRAACFASGSESGSEEELGRKAGRGKLIGGEGKGELNGVGRNELISNELNGVGRNELISNELIRDQKNPNANHNEMIRDQKSPNADPNPPIDHSYYLYDELYDEPAPQKTSSAKGQSKYTAKFIERAKERKEKTKPPSKDPNSIVIFTEGYKSHTTTTNHQSTASSEHHTQETVDRSFIQDQIAQLKDQKKHQFTEKYIEIISSLTQSALGAVEIEEARKRYFERAKKTGSKTK